MVQLYEMGTFIYVCMTRLGFLPFQMKLVLHKYMFCYKTIAACVSHICDTAQTGHPCLNVKHRCKYRDAKYCNASSCRGWNDCGQYRL